MTNVFCILKTSYIIITMSRFIDHPSFPAVLMPMVDQYLLPTKYSIHCIRREVMFQILTMGHFVLYKRPNDLLTHEEVRYYTYEFETNESFSCWFLTYFKHCCPPFWQCQVMPPPSHLGIDLPKFWQYELLPAVQEP